MRKILITTVALSMIAGASLAQTAPPRQERPTTGDCISDGFYGNEPNIVGPFAPGGPSEQEPGTKGGRVVPSQSPGPKVNNPADPDNPRPGASVGDVNRVIREGNLDLAGQRNLPQYCKAITDAQQGDPSAPRPAAPRQ